MKSYSQGRALYGSLTKNTSAANLTLGDQFANDDYRRICGLRDWPFLERLRTLITIASTQSYYLPYDVDQVREVSVTVSTKRYVPHQSPNKEHWDMLNLSQFTSDIPEWWFIEAGQIYLWPRPASSGNTIRITAKVRVIDLSIADFTTGTIVSIANGATTVTGSGTSWTAGMVGQWIRITNTAGGAGDGVWYEISAITDSTHLELVRMYGGTTIATGSATYTMGQMPLLPENYHDVPWEAAAAIYWGKEDDSKNRSTLFKSDHDAKVKEMMMNYSSPSTDMVIDDGREYSIINPNLTINL
jgi:hypothetical protein